ncbi:hypothetical protein PZ938_17815 [Luteipulveratus sp. YIM 133132]|uniref:AbiEi antitoxin C-terminal domain-containing protein n=1 Tax=Luteipulveratus flavus TaxID=3031728 RepID=A0ABT6C3L0_9MICO|nr:MULTISPECIES: hypothetical protein [unclassified Luteipulveratus]MDE9367482.1 hypothetical protein [Luteipulveratus sp. YIM 133132]MDF8263452.1 hypothetical protein [Luteipulveratus sp. YIM 133296]
MTATASTLPGLLLLQGEPRRVGSWVARGTVPAYVLPVGGWTAVVAAGESAAKAPYDDGLTMLANRPVPHGFRGSVGFFSIDGRAVVVVQRRGWRTIPRWLVWEPGHGAQRVHGLSPLRSSDLLDVVGVAPEETQTLRSLLRSTEGESLDLLRDLIDALALPAGRMLSGSGVPTQPDATLVTPGERDVARFERVVGEDRAIRAEQEDLS